MKSPVEILLVIAGALLFAFWSSGWLFQQGFWGIDDATYFRIVQAAEESRRTDGLAAAWQTLMPEEENNFGPTTGLYAWTTYKLFGTSAAWPYHLLKMLRQAAFLALVWGSARNLGAGRLGAATALLLAHLCGSTVIFPDMQTYPANWWRLYTTDSFGAVPFTGFWYLWSLEPLIRRSDGKIAALGGAAACFFIGLMAKATYILMPAALVLALILGAWGGVYRGRWRLHGPFFGSVLLLSLLAIPVYNIGGGFEVRRYDESLTLSPGGLFKGMWFFGSVLWETGLWLWVLPLCFLPGYLRRIGRRNANRFKDRRLLIALTALAAGCGGLLLQSGWPILLPRYMMAFVPPLALATGTAAGWAWKRLRENRAPSWLFYTAGGLLLAGAASLYLPMARGLLKLGFLAAMIALPVGLAALRRRGFPRKPAWRAIAGGWLAGSILLQAVVMGFNYAEARRAFQAIYIGENTLKTMLRDVPPRERQLPVYSTYGWREFFHNTLWFLNEVEGRTNLVSKPGPPPDTIPTPGAIHVFLYPHPGERDWWIPPGIARWRFEDLVSTEGEFRRVRFLSPGAEILFPIARIIHPVQIGQAIARFDTGSLPWTMSVELSLLDEQEQVLARAVFSGMDSPRQNTNEVPFTFPRPVEVPPGTLFVRLRLLRDDRPFLGLLEAFQKDDARLAILVMESEAGEFPGARLRESVPWNTTASRAQVQADEVWRVALHVHSPGAILREIVKSRGWGYSTQHLRLVRYHVGGTLAVFEE